jgi:predicted nucleic acid-binding protein
MAVAVFDADVLIGFLNQDDAQHDDAVHRVRATLAAGARRMLCAVNYSEVLIGPMRIGAATTVEAMVARLGIEIIPADAAMAERAATVRVQTGLKLPDAYALATVLHARLSGREEVQLESFDARLQRAHTALGA